MRNHGFTFKYVHSSIYGITYRADSRMLLPETRKSGITIPGRSGTYYQRDGAYNTREESFTCYYQPKISQTTARATRDIAMWLSGRGQIVFDDEPDKYYIGMLSGAPPLDRHLKYGEFELTFLYDPPFAFGAEQRKPLAVGVNPIAYAGTAETPCQIIINNTGSTTVQTLKITAIRRRAE